MSRGDYCHYVLVRPRKCGITTWVRLLAEQSPDEVVYWNALDVSRAANATTALDSLASALGLSRHRDEAVEEYLDRYVGSQTRDITIVVDNWDLALGENSQVTFDACYELLDSIARYVIDQATSAPVEVVSLGLVFVSSLLDSLDLERFARAARRPTFERLSGLITRHYPAIRVPFLVRPDAVAFLQAKGRADSDANYLADRLGGWIFLLDQCGGRSAPSVQDQREMASSAVLESTLQPLSRRPQAQLSVRTAQQQVARDLVLRRRTPAELGLPPDYRDGNWPAPAVREVLERSVIFVDTENLLMAYIQSARRYPADYPSGVDALMQSTVPSWIASIAAAEAVDERDIHLVGRSTARIDRVVGENFAANRRFLPDALRAKQKRRIPDSSDDSLLLALAAQMHAETPLTRFIVLSGDMDIPLILHEIEAHERLVVYAPWGVSPKMKEVVQDNNLFTHSLGPHPPR